jgi:hypothetical protein
MMKTFEAHSDGKVLVPDEPVDLPSGTRYRVSIEPVTGPASEKPSWLQEFARKFGGKAKGNYPPDLALNHDHYLHGRPKR